MKRLAFHKVALLAASLLAPTVKADVTFLLSTEFSGASDPSGTAPWLRAVFANAGANTVSLTLTSLLQASGEFVSEWDFNLNPAKSVASLNIVQNTGPTATVNKGTDAFKADGDGLYDIQLLFPSGSAADRFKQSSVATFTLTLAGLTENDFNFLSKPAGGHGPFVTAAHVQGISGGRSGWITDPDSDGGGGGGGAVPEPASILLLATVATVTARKLRQLTA